MAGKLPSIQFYTGDWLKDPNLSMCSAATRGIWIDAICAMHESGRCGTLSGTPEQLARVLRCSVAELHESAQELRRTNAARVTVRHGVVTLTNRRMAREHKERKQAALRQNRIREKMNGHARVTEKSRSLSSSSSSSSLLRERGKCDKGVTRAEQIEQVIAKHRPQP